MSVNRFAALRATARRSRVMELRKAGASYREIAERTHASVRTVWRDVGLELKRLTEETRATTETFRAMEMQRLDRLQLSHWPDAIGFVDKNGQAHPASVESAGIVLRIMDRRARLLGLDSPQQVEVGGVVGSVDLTDIGARLQQKLQQFLSAPTDIESTAVSSVLVQLEETTGNGNGNGPHHGLGSPVPTST